MGPANDERIREPTGERGASGSTPAPPRQCGRLRTGRARWMATHTPWRASSNEEARRRAGTRAAQRRRTRAHAARPVTPPGASNLAKESPWRSRSRGPRRPHPAFVDEIPSLSRETALGWLSICRPPSGRSPEVALRWPFDSVTHDSPRARAATTSLSPASRRPRVKATIHMDGERSRSRSPSSDRLDLDTLVPVRGGRIESGRGGWVEPSHEHPSSRSAGCFRGGDRGSLACEATRCADQRTPVGPLGYHREERGHEDHLRSTGPAKGAMVLVIRGAIHRFTRPRPGSWDRRADSNDTRER